MGKKNGRTDLVVGVCLDESGSMDSVHKETIEGFNEYLDGLRKQKGKTTITLTKFSSGTGQNYRSLSVNMSVDDFAGLTYGNYQPHGSTPLYDAIGFTVNALAHELRHEKKPNVLFIIQTDGHENDSREYTRQMVVDLIRTKEAEGWKFIYLGANQDAYEAEAAAVAMGVAVGASVSYDYASTAGAYSGLTQTSASLRANKHLTSAQAAGVVQDTIDSGVPPTTTAPPSTVPPVKKKQTKASTNPNF